MIETFFDVIAEVSRIKGSRDEGIATRFVSGRKEKTEPSHNSKTGSLSTGHV